MGATADSFTVEIGQSGAEDAASSLEDLKAQILADTKALREMQAAMKAMQGGSSVNISAFKELKSKIDAQKQSIADANSKFVTLGGVFGKTNKAVEEVSGSTEKAKVGFHELAGGVSGVTGPMGGMFERANKIVKVIGSAGMAGVALVAAAAVVVLTAALIAGAVAVAQWAVGLADANRNQDLMIEGLARSSKNLAGLSDAVDQVQGATGASVDSITKLAEELDAAGVSAKNMPNALKAIETAMQGGATAKEIAKIKAELQGGTKSAAALAAEMQTKFGDLVARKMLSLDAQATKFKNNIAGTFGGLKIEGLLNGIASLVDLFSQSTASGRALKFLFESMFQPLIDGATAAIPYIKAAFQQVIIYALKAYIAIRQFMKSDAGQALIAGLKVIGVVLGVIFAAATALYAVMALPFVLGAAAVAALVAGIGALVTWIGSLDFGSIADSVSSAFGAVVSFLGNLPGEFAELGANMITGLVQGISGAAGAVVDAITGAVGGAIKSAKSLLGIASPSKVMKGFGKFTGVGFAEGVEETTDRAQDAMTSMVAPPSPSAVGAPSSKVEASVAAGGNTFNITINGATPEMEKKSFWVDVAKVLEDAVTLGGGAPSNA